MMIVAFVLGQGIHRQTDNGSVNPASPYAPIKAHVSCFLTFQEHRCSLAVDLRDASPGRKSNRSSGTCVSSPVFQRNFQNRSGQVSDRFRLFSVHSPYPALVALLSLFFRSVSPNSLLPLASGSLIGCCVCLSCAVSVCLSDSCHSLSPSASHKVVLLVVGYNPITAQIIFPAVLLQYMYCCRW